MLAYGMKVHAIDEYCQFVESTTMECMKWVVHVIVAIFWPKYFWKPTRAKIENQLKINANRGFPSIFANFDIYALEVEELLSWMARAIFKKRCKKVHNSKVIANQSLCMWQASFGLPSGNNDINVLDQSPMVANMLNGACSVLRFEMSDNVYFQYYLLVDVIYFLSSCFVQTIHEP